MCYVNTCFALLFQTSIALSRCLWSMATMCATLVAAASLRWASPSITCVLPALRRWGSYNRLVRMAASGLLHSQSACQVSHRYTETIQWPLCYWYVHTLVRVSWHNLFYYPCHFIFCFLSLIHCSFLCPMFVVIMSNKQFWDWKQIFLKFQLLCPYPFWD